MSSSSVANSLEFLNQPGRVAALMREHDWSSSALDEPSNWPQSLRLVVTLMLASKFPMFVAWGDELSFLYNDAYADILAEKHPAALGGRFEDIWHEIWPDLTPLVESTLRGEAVYRANLPLLMQRNGYPEETWFTFSYSPARNDAGQVAGVFCAVVETTPAVVAERALRESERRLKLAIDGASIGTWDWDLVTSRGSWSPRTVEILGASSGENVTTEQRTETIHPEDRDRIWREYREAWKTGAPLVSEYRVVRPNGEVRWISSRGAFDLDEHGNRVRTAGIVIDVTDQKRTEARLQELNETLEAQVAAKSAERDLLWKLSQDMLARADMTGMMSAVSPAWTSILGWSEDELLARGYATFMHPEDVAFTLNALARMSESGVPTRFENRIAAKDGTYKPIEWTVTPEADGLNFIAVGRDLSHSKAREEELARTQEALRQAQKMEAVGQLTGGLAHDFNNLLMGVSGALELLQRRLAQGRADEVGKYVEMAEAGVSRAASLTHRLLAFSRRQTLDPRPAQISRIIAGVGEFLQRSVGPSISLDLSAVQAVSPTLLDHNQFENALLNLCINARDAMPDGGTIMIDAEDCVVDAVTASAWEMLPGGYVRVSVVDRGSGMDADTIARAFDPFYTTKPTGEGTGLGLSMVYGFVRQSGGHVRIISQLDRGTRVDMYFPRSEARTDEPEEALITRAEGSTAHGEAIMVVDDDLTIRSLIAEELREVGYRTIEASNGVEALAILENGQNVDLLITDVGMPGGVNGRQLADAARKTRPSLNVLFITGYAEAAVIGDDRLDPGMFVMTKPFQIDALAARARELMESRRAS